MLKKGEKPKAGDNVSAEEEIRKTIENGLDTAEEAALSEEHPDLLAKCVQGLLNTKKFFLSGRRQSAADILKGTFSFSHCR